VPSYFDSFFAASGFPVLLTQFGETVTYEPVGGVRRSVSAIVEREPPATYDKNGNVALYAARIRVLNDSTLGITGEELIEGQDTVSLLQRIGDSSDTTFSTRVLESQDSGVTVIGLVG